MRAWMLFRMGVRNLWRQPRRTLLALVLLSVAAVAVLFTRAWQNGMMELINREGAGTWLGAVQIRPQGAQEAKDAFSLSPSLTLDDTMAARIRAVEGTGAISPRIRFFGRLYKGEESAPFMGLGTDVASAVKVVPRLLEPERLEAGAPLVAGRDDEILVAAPLAASLGVQPGDTVTLVARPIDGGLEGVDVKVAGLLRAAFEEDQKRAVVVPLATARKLLRMEDQATAILVDVQPLSRAREVARALQNSLSSHASVEVMAWDEINRRHQDARAIWRLSLGVMFIVVALVAALGLSTTLSLIVSERTKEIGTLAAIGMPRRAVLGMFMLEGALLGALGGVGGVALGWALVAWVHRVGVQFTPPEGFTVTVRPTLSVAELVTAVAVLGALAGLVSFFPALSAARRSPVEALQ